MEKAAVLLMGLPGAAKGTQAFQINQVFPNFVHFDTGGEIYRKITDLTFENDPVVIEQKKVYLSGKLNDPKWVAELVAERIRFYSQEDKGIVFSGSPRTLFEAKEIAPILFDNYGRDRVLVLFLDISEETALARSLGRLICTNKTCRYPTTKDKAGYPCPSCSQILPKDTQDEESWKIDQIQTRFDEYQERTVPVLEYLLSFGIMETIDGERTKKEVSAQIHEMIERRLA